MGFAANQRVVSLWGAALIFVLCLCGGCSESSQDRTIVSGVAAYNDKQIDSGQIRFLPDQSTQSSMSGAVIQNGHYVANFRGGLLAGRYRVEILAFEKNSAAANAEPTVGGANVAGKQYLPERFNSKSDIFLLVPGGSREMSHDFQLKD